jgi:hypothetical protein
MMCKSSPSTSRSYSPTLFLYLYYFLINLLKKSLAFSTSSGISKAYLDSLARSKVDLTLFRLNLRSSALPFINLFLFSTFVILHISSWSKSNIRSLLINLIILNRSESHNLPSSYVSSIVKNIFLYVYVV